jgi:hypothetical protein
MQMQASQASYSAIWSIWRAALRLRHVRERKHSHSALSPALEIKMTDPPNLN